MSNTDKIADILKDFKALNELEQIKELYFYAKTINSLYTTEISEEDVSDEREQAVKRGGEDYADNYIEGLEDGWGIGYKAALSKSAKGVSEAQQRYEKARDAYQKRFYSDKMDIGNFDNSIYASFLKIAAGLKEGGE